MNGPVTDEKTDTKHVEIVWDSKWIRMRDIPKEYYVSLSYAQQLVSDMRADEDTTEKDFIVDGKIRLIRRSKLEDFWRKRGKQNAG